ncbi:MAG: hypothetical protein IKX24_04585 [Prevotella sp.]|nr:hypothetical protein [Prevotella sp.]
MSHKRTQNRIAESRIALPFAIVYGILVCMAYGVWGKNLWITTAGFAISTLLMAELNNSNALIRIYSRMVSCSFLFLSVRSIFLLHSMQATIVVLCLIAFYLSLFKAYQNKKATGWVYYAFFAIGMASLVFVKVLYFVPILWFLLIFKVLSFSPKTFVASLLGLITPYWFIGGYDAYSHNFHWVANHFKEMTEFFMICDYQVLSQHQLITFAWIALLLLIGTIHFLNKRYNDKLRTRMLYDVFIVTGWCAIVFCILQPQHYFELLGIIIVNTAPLIGHFIATTQTKFTNFSFYIILIVTLAITFFNVWMPSMTF